MHFAFFGGIILKIIEKSLLMLSIIIISLLCGMSGCKSKNKKFSNIANMGIIISFVPLLLFVYLLLTSSY